MRKEKLKNNKILVITIYSMIVIITASVFLYVFLASPSPGVGGYIDKSATRDSYKWDEKIPERLNKSWEKEGYTHLINPVGTIVAGKKDSVERLDSKTGEVVWSYEYKNAELCDTIEANENVAAVFDRGRGCSDIILLDAETGEYIAQAQYGTDSHVARLVYANEKIAVVTPHFVRLVNAGSLSPSSEFGGQDYPVYSSDQEVSDCDITDVGIGPKSYVVAARCLGDDNYHVRVIESEPEESTEGKVLINVDTGSKSPVTVPMVSLSMFSFVTSDQNPSLYVWQLDKEQEEVSHKPLKPNNYGFGFKDIHGIGYVWKVGDSVNVRHGSEDISQSISKDGAVGFPMEADGKLLIPKKEGVLMWNTENSETKMIETESDLDGVYFAFSGSTVADYNQETGKITAYSSESESE